ncbi:GntR family transcriptional regulator [Paenibacillus solani]|uniref:GntR family transcriptional regulator n=1 Tax=Paenibacillus solani TaxID=1705565 RepID=UPI003D2B7909
MLSIQIREESSEPLYVQIRDQLKGLIISGSLSHGDLLPSLRELAGQLDCSLITVRRVYGDLEGEGLLLVKKGIGTFVNYDPSKIRKSGERQVLRAFQEAVQIGKMYHFNSNQMVDILDRLLIEEG